MQLHTLKRRTKNKKNPSKGRGGKRGKTSGRGTKGQKARSGRKLRPEMRDIIKKFPKLRGRGKQGLKTIQNDVVPVSLTDIDNNFSAGDEVTVEILVKKGVVEKVSGKFPRVKVLNNGDISKKVSLKGVSISKTAKDKIEKAGGKVA